MNECTSRPNFNSGQARRDDAIKHHRYKCTPLTTHFSCKPEIDYIHGLKLQSWIHHQQPPHRIRIYNFNSASLPPNNNADKLRTDKISLLPAPKYNEFSSHVGRADEECLECVPTAFSGVVIKNFKIYITHCANGR